MHRLIRQLHQRITDTCQREAYDYELILVDDGSTDGNLDSIRNFIAPESGNINFTYVYFPRARKRRRPRE